MPAPTSPVVYIAGPSDFEALLSQSPNDKRRVRDVYNRILEATSELRYQAQMPVSDPYLASLTPRAFYDKIAERIRSADAVIWVCTPGDMSGAVESSIAAVAGKKQLILRAPAPNLPRMVSGQPGVAAISGVDDTPELKEVVKSFLADDVTSRAEHVGGPLPVGAALPVSRPSKEAGRVPEKPTDTTLP